MSFSGFFSFINLDKNFLINNIKLSCTRTAKYISFPISAMNISPQLSATTPTTPDIFNDDVFYTIIDRLKSQKALSSEDFASEDLSKEAQVQDLYKTLNSADLHTMLKKLMESADTQDAEVIKKRLSASQVMSFAQIILYKVLPCSKEDCLGRPRETVIQNQYKDYEYECPFYHHEKDQRRMVITAKVNDEFVFKANYNENKTEDSSKCSQNHFESVFHPLYYKLFKCKREHCNVSVHCPFYHTEEEKKTWDRSFSNYIRKDRISYVKEKQKYYENANKNGAGSYNKKNFHQKKQANPPTLESTRIFRAGSDKTAEIQVQEANPSSFSPYGITRTEQQPKTSTFQQRSVIELPDEGEWAAEKNVKLEKIKPWGNKKTFVKRFIEKDLVSSSLSVTSGASSDTCETEKSVFAAPSRGGWRSSVKKAVERND